MFCLVIKKLGCKYSWFLYAFFTLFKDWFIMENLTILHNLSPLDLERIIAVVIKSQLEEFRKIFQFITLTIIDTD